MMKDLQVQKDVFSLIFRLSITKYFLKEAEGFLIMDNPFVDTDRKSAKSWRYYPKVCRE